MKNNNIENLWRSDFPMLSNRNSDKKFIYMDSASTTFKPTVVVDAVSKFYTDYTSNVSRSSHFLSEKVFEAHDLVREKIASFVNARKKEIIFTHSCTDSINQVARGLHLKKDDEIILSSLEHHSNFLPWCEHATVKIVRIDENGIIDLNHLRELVTDKTKLIAVTYISNVTGNIQPVKEVVQIAREKEVLSLIDAAQAVGHLPVDVFDMDCDFMVFSAHKMLGPSGVGVLYVKDDAFHILSPTQYGGGMVNKISPQNIDYFKGYSLFEAGTPNIEGVLGFGAAIDYLDQIGIQRITDYLDFLEAYCKKELLSSNLITFPFPINADAHSPIFSFVPKNMKADIGYISNVLSDVHGIAVRDGFQCAQPLYSSKNINGAIRVSLYLYNTIEEVDALIYALNKLRNLLI